MSTRAQTYAAQVCSRERLSEHLLRLVLAGDGLAGWTSTGIPDEWVGLVVPGQFQSRYYTVRRWAGGELTLDVVVHDEGLVTEWASRDCVGDEVTVTDPKGSFAPPAGSAWLLLVGDLTALPAMARIAESMPGIPTRIWAEVPDDLPGYLPESAEVAWLRPPAPGRSDLAAVVEGIDWPVGEGYFWMAGESGQMRAIRKHLMRVRRLPSASYDVMGYWRGGAVRQPRAVDPGPVWRAGKAAGKSDDEIWADYDAAQAQQESR
ncbi:siderophore-interacting protein [Nocardioides sp.]|uniref:siderophore-interacting protein n=1 Tax=Nocardioides sp. TaxID=35761 RepID=UPI003526FC99